MRRVTDRSPHGLVVVSGPDATSFLQSLVSQDLDRVGDGQSARSLLLTPQGKLDVVFRVTRVGEQWWLDTDADYGPRLAASLTRFRIRVQAELDDRTAGTGLLSVLGTDTLEAPDAITIPTRWGDVTGVDVLGPATAVASAWERLETDGYEQMPFEAFEALRIEQGVPRQGVDVDEKTIAQEAFLDRDAVAFEKGCFLGQELVARIDSRGHVNRYLRRVRVPGGPVPPRGAVVVAGEKEVGTVTSAAAVPGEDRAVALAMIRREVDPPADVVLRWDGTESPAHVLASESGR